MELKILPETFEGCQTDDLLKVWQEIKSKEGTKAPREQIRTMGNFLREYKLGLFGVAKKADPVLNAPQKKNPTKIISDENPGQMKMKVGYKKAIEILFTEYEKLKSQNGNPDDIKSIREGIEYLCYPFQEDLTENIRSPIQDPDEKLYLDKADRSTQEQEKIFWQHMTGLTQKNIETTLYALETLKKL